MGKNHEYLIRRLDEKRFSVFKEELGTHEQTYTIENSDCDCPGARYHRTQCKHLKIRNAWVQLGEPSGVFFTVDRKSGEPMMHKLEGLTDGN